MALGRQRDRQAEMLVAWSEMPRSPGHIFYDRLQAELVAAGFDGFVEGQCAPHYAARQGRPSLPPGRYFRMLLVGYFEGIDSERGLANRLIFLYPAAMVRALKARYLRAGESLAIPCQCGRRRVLDGDKLTQVIGTTPLQGIETRLRCKACGTRPPLDVWVK